MLLANVALLVIGTVIDGIPGLIMTVPILLPIATEVYGIDPRHFGVVAVVNLVLGLLSPPVGLCFLRGPPLSQVPSRAKCSSSRCRSFLVSCILWSSCRSTPPCPSSSSSKPNPLVKESSPCRPPAACCSPPVPRFRWPPQPSCTCPEPRIAPRHPHPHRPSLEQCRPAGRRCAEGRNQWPPDHDRLPCRAARQ